jgi:hypothetical protein
MAEHRENSPDAQLNNRLETGIVDYGFVIVGEYPMPKEIKSAATKDSASTSNDRALRNAAKRDEAPDPNFYNDYELDLRSNEGSLQKVANQINRKEQS